MGPALHNIDACYDLIDGLDELIATLKTQTVRSVAQTITRYKRALILWLALTLCKQAQV